MLYFKNTELAEAYHVSLRTVLNWIEAAKNDKLDLLLHEHKGKLYVANTTQNVVTIKDLVEKRRKYRNKRSFKTIAPTDEFYKLYDEQQILDIISNIEIHSEIPGQYNYFGEGANYWDHYVQRLAKETTPNLLNGTLKLIELNQDYLDSLTERYKKVNVIDIGVGDALHAKGLVHYLKGKGLLGKYIGIDISSTMLQMAEKNLKSWFGADIPIECHELDISFERFTHLSANEYISQEPDSIVNIVLLLGGTLANFRSPDAALNTIHESMDSHDIFIHSIKLDTTASRRYFDFGSEPGGTRLSPSDRFILDVLNIDESLYDVEMGFNEKEKQRYIRIRLKMALTIKFHFKSGERVVELNKDDTLLLWRYWHQSSLDVIKQFERNEFHPLQISQTEDKEYILTISKIKS